ncbi:hypothetical protein ACF061_12120 [Streptomyces sp. NPDC015220]|uniref:hypothetical protein n=1 Tax=Streptomyces sp. NPDC015220 TaxID=3364947 RepID=UPI0036FD94F8
MVGLLGDRHLGRASEETVISAIRNTLAATAVATAVLAGTAACGTVENLTAGQKLDRAFDKLGEQHSLTLELGLDTDAATLKALDADAKPEDKMPDGIAELFSGARISVSVESKKPLKDSDDKDFSAMALKFSGPKEDLFEYRLIGDDAYVRADVNAFAKISGSPMPGTDELPPEAGAFKKVLAGEWIKVSAKDLRKTGEEMAQQEAAGGGKPSASPTLDAQAQKKLMNDLRQVIVKEVEFKTAGGTDGTEHVKATAPFRTLLTELLDEIRPLAGQLAPGGGGLPTADDLKDAPNKKVTADFALKNGALSDVSVDLAPLAEEAKGKKLALVLRTVKGARTTAPSGATEVRVDQLMEGFFGGLMGGGTLGEGTLSEDDES